MDWEGMLKKIYLALNIIVIFLSSIAIIYVAINYNEKYGQITATLGSLATFFCIVGLQASIRESRAMYMSYAFGTVVICSLYLFAAGNGIWKREDLDTFISKMSKELPNDNGTVTASQKLQYYQHVYSCCGLKNWEDYGVSVEDLPSSCCEKYKDKSCENQHSKGCVEVIFRQHSVGYIVTLLIGGICAAMLFFNSGLALRMAMNVPSDWWQVFI